MSRDEEEIKEAARRILRAESEQAAKSSPASRIRKEREVTLLVVAATLIIGVALAIGLRLFSAVR